MSEEYEDVNGPNVVEWDEEKWKKRKTQMDTASKRMGVLLLEGWTMLADHCAQCGSPLMKFRNSEPKCVLCDEIQSNVVNVEEKKKEKITSHHDKMEEDKEEEEEEEKLSRDGQRTERNAIQTLLLDEDKKYSPKPKIGDEEPLQVPRLYSRDSIVRGDLSKEKREDEKNTLRDSDKKKVVQVITIRVLALRIITRHPMEMNIPIIFIHLILILTHIHIHTRIPALLLHLHPYLLIRIRIHTCLTIHIRMVVINTIGLIVMDILKRHQP